MLFSQHSKPINLSSRRLFITGGTGIIGRTLLDYINESVCLHGSGVEVHVLSRDTDAFRARFPKLSSLPWLYLVKGDIATLRPSGETYTDVIHAAADTHASGGSVQWIDQIVGGTRAILEYARNTGASRFLLTSSGAVYGPQPATLDSLHEDLPSAPPTSEISSVYGQSKRLAEQLCTVYWKEHGLETVNARLFAVLSEHLPPNGPYAIANFIRDALFCEQISVKGNGQAVRTYLYGRDMAHWLVTLLLYGEPGKSYNVGSDEPLSISNLAQRVLSALNINRPISIEHRAMEDGARSIYIPSIDNARSLGLQVETTLDDGIRRTAKHFAQQ